MTNDKEPAYLLNYIFLSYFVTNVCRKIGETFRYERESNDLNFLPEVNNGVKTMRAVRLFAVFCLTILIGAAASAGAFGQEPKTAGENPNPPKEAVRERLTNTSVPTETKRSDDRYRIGFQDTIEVTVYKHGDFGGTFNVSSDGTIRLPRLDEPIYVVCKTERELAEEIAQKHKTILKNPFVNVRAVEQRSQSFAVIGAVEKPGSFYLNRRIRLLELLSFAGGPSDKAGRKMIVARTGSSSVCRQENNNVAVNDDSDVTLSEFVIDDVLKGKTNAWMQPGDIVSVMEADVAYVVGNVNKPKTIQLKDPITLTQAIAAAEGLKPSTKKDKVRILRQKPDSIEREEMFFDLVAIDKRQIQDPLLLPNDIVDVSEDSKKAAIKKVINIFTGGLGNVPYLLGRP